jgi:hypothetical protein
LDYDVVCQKIIIIKKKVKVGERFQDDNQTEFRSYQIKRNSILGGNEGVHI